MTGKSGRPYPARRPTTVAAFSAKEEERARVALKELGDNAPSRPTRVGPLEKRVKANRVRPASPPTGESFFGSGGGWEIQNASIEDFDVDGLDIHYIVTDPPYNEDGIECYRRLGEFAKKHLEPGGLVVAYLGKFYLREALEGLFENLDYVWLGAVVQNSRPTKIHAKKIDGGYRPFVICSVGEYEPRRWMHDTIVSPHEPERDRHPWQQALRPFVEIVEMISEPNDVICDPFCGSGTTGVAAISLGRDFIGCDIDRRTATEAKERLEEWERQHDAVYTGSELESQAAALDVHVVDTYLPVFPHHE